MSVFGIKTNRIISADVSIVAMPVLLVIVLVVMFVSSFKFAYPKITTQISELDKVGQQLTILETKLSILRQVEDKVLGAADISLIALPDENPGVWKLSQIALLAEKSDVVVSARKVFKETSQQGNTKSTEITFVANGTFDNTLDFFNNLNESVPLTTLESVKIDNSGENLNSKIRLLVYRAELPKLLPAITAPIKNLSNKEQELLNKLDKLSRPEFTYLEPSGPFEKIDPFN